MGCCNSLAGFVIFIASLFGLFVNEGYTIKERVAVDEFRKFAANVDFDCNKDNVHRYEGKIIYDSGCEFKKVSPNRFVDRYGLNKFKDSVEVYEHVEEFAKFKVEVPCSDHESRHTCYEYKHKWQSKEVPFTAETLSISELKVGYNLQIKRRWLNEFINSVPIHDVRLVDPSFEQANIELCPSSQYYYYNFDYSGGSCNDLNTVGTYRVGYQARQFPINADLLETTVFGLYNNEGLSVYTARNGHNIYPVVHRGYMSRESIIEKMYSSVNFFCWVVRGFGFLVAWLGMFLVFSFAGEFVQCIPCMENAVNSVVALSTFFMAMGSSLITISIGWVYYRPIIGIPLLVLGITLVFAMILRSCKKNNNNDNSFPAPHQQAYIPPSSISSSVYDEYQQNLGHHSCNSPMSPHHQGTPYHYQQVYDYEGNPPSYQEHNFDTNGNVISTQPSQYGSVQPQQHHHQQYYLPPQPRPQH